MIKAMIWAKCDKCKNEEYIADSNFENSKTETIKKAKNIARERGWIITREKKYYCKKCAEELKLRNSKKNYCKKYKKEFEKCTLQECMLCKRECKFWKKG